MRKTLTFTAVLVVVAAVAYAFEEIRVPKRTGLKATVVTNELAEVLFDSKPGKVEVVNGNGGGSDPVVVQLFDGPLAVGQQILTPLVDTEDRPFVNLLGVSDSSNSVNVDCRFSEAPWSDFDAPGVPSVRPLNMGISLTTHGYFASTEAQTRAPVMGSLLACQVTNGTGAPANVKLLARFTN